MVQQEALILTASLQKVFPLLERLFCSTIIADSAERARNIDVKRAQSAKKRAEQHMQEAKEKHNEREMLEAEIALRRAVNRLHVRENYGK